VVEQRGEDLRLLYVALTRARNQAVIWWAGTYDSSQSPLSRLLFARDGDGNVGSFGDRTPSDADVEAGLRALIARSGGSVAVERVAGVPRAAWRATAAPPPELRRATFERTIDEAWRRTSYTAITSDAGEARVASEPEEGVVADEDRPGAGGAQSAGSLPPATSLPSRSATGTVPSGAGDGGEDRLLAVPLLLAGMPGGAEVGTVVHRVLEATDFAAVDLASELCSRLAAEVARRPLDLGDPDAVVAGLRAVIESPLGPLAGGARLRDIGRRDRLDELVFELPLAGGDAPHAGLTVSDVAALLDRLLPAGDELAGYAARLVEPALDQPLRGYLTGSLDLVLRLPGPRFVVVDYKTNRVGGADEVPSAWQYRPEALRVEMWHAHYPLQALLYTVALHRYLRWRLPGYRPSRHLAGVLYLFVRGMSSPRHPDIGGQPCGVWSWPAPPAVVTALSDLLEQGRQGT
jgi:exodeoxyribonuclease V beta subunit